MKLSIIVPVFNAEHYLQNCLESIREQTHENFEVILINDGSVDGSGMICETFAQLDKRFIYVDQENTGVAMARNVGLERAKGDYIGFVDADDTIEPTMFENLIKPLSKQDFEVVIAHYKICNKTNFNLSETKLPSEVNLNSEQIKNHILKTYYTGNDALVPALWNKIYKRSFIETQHLRFHNQKAVRASDYWFNFEVFQLAQSAYVIKDANYRYNNAISGSIINTFRPNQFQGFLDTMKKLLDANEQFKFEIDYPKFYEIFYNNTNHFILSAIRTKGLVKAYPMVQPILKNDVFKKSINYLQNEKKHTKIINSLIKKNQYKLAYTAYGLWFLKLKS